MPTIPFPNVPQVPGVPQVPRSPNFPPTVQGALGLLQGALWRATQTQARWGIFDARGRALGDPTQFTGVVGLGAAVLGVGATLSTNSVDYSKESRVSDFPVERGGFASYNKVETPAAPLVTLCFQGNEVEGRAFLAQVDAASKSTDLYSVVTPEVTYVDYNIERYNYGRHTSKGATLLIVELMLKEIRQVSAQYSVRTPVVAPKVASATPSADNGKVQPQTPPTSTLKGLVDKIPGLLAKVLQ